LTPVEFSNMATQYISKSSNRNMQVVLLYLILVKGSDSPRIHFGTDWSRTSQIQRPM